MNILNQYLLEKTMGKFLFQGHILWQSREWPWQRFFSLWGERYGAPWGTLCSKSPGPDGIHPWVLNEIKWEIMSSVTRIYNRCLKTAYIPEDWKVINMVSHTCGVCRVCVLCVCSLNVVGHLGERDEGDFPFFKNQGKFLDETKDRGDLGSGKSIKSYEAKY